MSPIDPGRFTRAALHSEVGEAELRLSSKGNWQLRIRTGEDCDWRLVCSGDLQGGRIAPQADPEPALRLGPLTLDRAARRVRVRDTEVRLSNREFELLATLASQPSRVFTKAELMRGVWGREALHTCRTLDSHASRLRIKLREAGAVGFVVNHWGVGYRLWGAPERVLAPVA